jgi:hypothetical protein
MYQTINLHDFRKAFHEIRPNNFSYEGLGILFDYFEQLEDEIGEKIELDVIAICCDYSEDSLSNIVDYYSINLEGEDDHEQAVKDYLENATNVIGFTKDKIIYQIF